MSYTLITGASGGIGEATAREFAAKKHNLVLVARNESKLKQLCNELLKSHAINAEYIVADLSSSSSPQQLFDECQRRNIRIDVLINNAGIGSSGEFAENDLKSELDIIQINCTSLTALTHLFLQDMKQRKSGTVINLGSMIAFIASPYMSVYAGSKHYVKVFSYSLAEECKPYGVHVLFFSPGLTSSNFMKTRANDNDWGKALTDDAATQSPAEVAKELMQAFDQQKSYHVSGGKNRLMALISGMIPLRTIAHLFGKQKQKQMGIHK